MNIFRQKNKTYTSPLGERISEIAKIAAEKLTDDKTEIESTVQSIRMQVQRAVNEYVSTEGGGQKILNSSERSKLKELRKRADHIKQIIEDRDPEYTETLIQRHGDNYVDFHKMELNAIEWAIEFIQERSL